MREHFNLAADFADTEWDSGNLEYRRLASHALFTADSIDGLVETVPEIQRVAWRNTLKGLVAEHSEFTSFEKFSCDEFDKTFIDEYVLDNEKFEEAEKTAVQEALNSNSRCL